MPPRSCAKPNFITFRVDQKRLPTKIISWHVRSDKISEDFFFHQTGLIYIYIYIYICEFDKFLSDLGPDTYPESSVNSHKITYIYKNCMPSRHMDGTWEWPNTHPTCRLYDGWAASCGLKENTKQKTIAAVFYTTTTIVCCLKKSAVIGTRNTVVGCMYSN